MRTAEFDKLNDLYGAIKDIDRIIDHGSEDKIEDLLTAVKDIDTKEFKEEYIYQIIMGFRSAILDIYKENLDIVNHGIDNPGSLNSRSKNTAIIKSLENISEINLVNRGE